MSSREGPVKFQKPYVVIPTYNEKDNIVRLIQEVLKFPQGFHILVVDDNSPDGTGALVEEMASKESRVHVFHRPGKLGLGTAYVEGFRWALAQGADVVCEMDADYSHDPNVLPKFLEELQTCDVAIGSRYVNGISVVNWPLRRLAISLIASLYVREILQLPVKDSTSGFVAYRRRVLEGIDLGRIKSNGYAFQIEMKFLAYHEGFTLNEVPIIFVDRFIGTSKISRHIVWEAIFIVWRLRVEAMWRGARTPR